MKPRTNHPIRVISAPAGGGSGEQFVREQYPQQLRALRNIETWLAYLNGATVDETTSYPKLEKPGQCKSHVRQLSDMCGRQELRAPAPPSLTAACVEYRNVYP